jgi:drug/metabolite transporter (DMT)-like permease
MLLGVGITGTIGQIFLTKAFAVGDPSRVSVVGLSQVGFGALLELIFFDRTFHGLTLLGMGLIIVPSAWLLLHRAAPELPDPQLN